MEKNFRCEEAAFKHITSYFSDISAHQYKSVRNSLDGWSNSTKFSPWLANGCISARQITDSLYTFEKREGQRIRVIGFSNCYGVNIFFGMPIIIKNLFLSYQAFMGEDHYSFYPERFMSWTNGTTPYPIVNACMTQLKKTGYVKPWASNCRKLLY